MCFVHGADVVCRWSYRSAWLLGRSVRCVDALPWGSLERGKRALGGVKVLKFMFGEKLESIKATSPSWMAISD